MVWCALSYGVSSVLASISLGAFVLVRPRGFNGFLMFVHHDINGVMDPVYTRGLQSELDQTAAAGKARLYDA